MVFSSLLFTFYFLPAVLLLYFLAKESYRNGILLVCSLLFYAYGEPRFVLLMLLSIALNYVLAMAISAKKIGGGGKCSAKSLLLLAIAANLGLLYLFKYLDFSVDLLNRVLGTEIPAAGLPLPIGISFFTFQALSYVIDVYRETVQVQKNPIDLALYISFFPQLIAGPIVRYRDIEQQLRSRVITLDGFAEGARRFFLGFIKKVLLANHLASLVSIAYYRDCTHTNPVLLWLGAVSYSLQIFYDFSGYSDMAIGLGRMFGFSFQENFRYPYISKSITEFWRRWHISLSGWFRDYVYIPLGGSRVRVGRHLLNLLIVWMLTGIWHGANLTFLAWGIGYFCLLVIEKYLVHPERWKHPLPVGIWRLVTLLCINFGWVIFQADTLRGGIKCCLSMLGYYAVPWRIDGTVLRCLREYGCFLLAGILFAAPIAQWLRDKTAQKQGIFVSLSSVAVPLCYGGLFLWAVSFLILGAHNPFIYFNF